jgi:chromosome segregation ATPase
VKAAEAQLEPRRAALEEAHAALAGREEEIATRAARLQLMLEGVAKQRDTLAAREAEVAALRAKVEATYQESLAAAEATAAARLAAVEADAAVRRAQLDGREAELAALAEALRDRAARIEAADGAAASAAWKQVRTYVCGAVAEMSLNIHQYFIILLCVG